MGRRWKLRHLQYNGHGQGQPHGIASAQRSCQDWRMTLATTFPRCFCSFSQVSPGKWLDRNDVNGYVCTHLVCLRIIHTRSRTHICVWMCICIQLHEFHATGKSSVTLIILCIAEAVYCWKSSLQGWYSLGMRHRKHLLKTGICMARWEIDFLINFSIITGLNLFFSIIVLFPEFVSVGLSDNCPHFVSFCEMEIRCNFACGLQTTLTYL